MQSTRIVPRSLAALVFAACVGLGSPARTWADNPTDRPLVSSSVPDTANLAEASDPASSPEQVQEAADYLLSETGAALRCLVFTMINWDLPTTPPPPPPPPSSR